MNILFCSGEAHPFSKSGGLADVSYALPKALSKKGIKSKLLRFIQKNSPTKRKLYENRTSNHQDGYP